MDTRVTVIGTVFVDCKGFSHNEFNPAGRNIGDVKFFHGGVGRNVAETMALLGVPVTFLSTVDLSGIGDEVVSRLEAADIDTCQLVRTESAGMGFWLAILDRGGELAGAISQMPDLTALEEYVLAHGQDIVSQSSDIVLELDLNACITKHVIALAKKAGKPVYGIPGNLSVVMEHPDVLSDIDCFICNDIEAAKLLDIRLDRNDREALLSHVQTFVDSCGLRSMVVTLGEEGAVYYDSLKKEFGYQPVFPVQVVETSGAGDSFFSGTVMGLVAKKPMSHAVVLGSKVASWTIQSTENVCFDLPQKTKAEALFDKTLAFFNTENNEKKLAVG